MVGKTGQAGEIQGFDGRGVFVPEGMEAWQIMAGARALERRHDVTPYISRCMVRDVLDAIRAERRKRDGRMKQAKDNRLP